MDIGKRLRDLREAHGLSQGDIEDRTGLLRTYVSTVENGHRTPSLQVLEKWANGLDVDLYQLFVVGHGEPKAHVIPEQIPGGAEEQTLLGLFGQMPVDYRALLLSLARDMVKQKGKRG